MIGIQGLGFGDRSLVFRGAGSACWGLISQVLV